MPFNIPPPPSEQRVDSWPWRDWFNRLRSAVLSIAGEGEAGQVPISPGPGLPPVWTTFRLEQAFTSQTVITVVHSFGFFPIVQVLNDQDCMIIPKQIRHTDTNTVIVFFSIPVTGTVIVSM